MESPLLKHFAQANPGIDPAAGTANSTADPAASAASAEPPAKRNKGDSTQLPTTTTSLAVDLPLEFSFAGKTFHTTAALEHTPVHWICWVRNAQHWWRCDDNIITQEASIPQGVFAMIIAKHTPKKA